MGWPHAVAACPSAGLRCWSRPGSNMGDAACPLFSGGDRLGAIQSARCGRLGRAASMGIATAVVDHKSFDTRLAFEEAVHETLVAANIEIVCLAGFMRILSSTFVERWSGRMLNVHPSLLPSFSGLDTHARALKAGVRLHGCTVHIVTPELDAGPIVVQAAMPVFNDDTPESLATRLIAEEQRCYVTGLRLLAGGRLTVDGDRVLIDGDADLAGGPKGVSGRNTGACRSCAAGGL